jgi:folate-binding protein YgfZ
MMIPPSVSFDLSDWMQLDLLGKDARTFLHNFCTNDVLKLPEHGRCEAFLCDVKGKILGHVQIYSIPGGLRLISVPGAADLLVPHLQKYLLGADVEFVNRALSHGLLCLAGPAALGVLNSVTGVPLEIGEMQNGSVETPRGTLWGGGIDCLPVPAWLISAERDVLGNLREQIPDELLAMGTRALFDLLRIEAGYPWYGRDISAANLAQEAARTEQAISFQKGCYLGQEPIARLDALGHTNRELRGILIQGVPPQAGGTVLLNGESVGTVTSLAIRENGQAAVALALLRTKATAAGTAVQIQNSAEDGAGELIAGEVFWPRLSDSHS